MKFTQNTPIIEPNTINNVQVQAVRDPMAYGMEGKNFDAVAGAIGQMARVAQKAQDDVDSANLMEARNKIMSSLTSSLYGEKGILTTGVGENAKGLEGRVTDTVQKTFDYYSKQYNKRVQRALRGNLNENMANYQRIAAQQEGREFKKQQESQTVIGLQNQTDMATMNWQDENILNSSINEGLRIADYWAYTQGMNEMQRQQSRRNAITSIAGGAISNALVNEDYQTADMYLQRYGREMNQGDVMKYQKQIRQDKQTVDERNEIDDLFNTYRRPDGSPDMEKIEAEIKKRAKETKVVGGSAGGYSDDRFVRIAQKTADIIRQKYPDASPNLAAYLYGQMMHESAWGQDPKALEYNNFAGLHGGAEGRQYKDDDDYAADYASFFTDGYHTQAIYATDGTDFARRLSNKLDGGSGWYEDRNYQAYGKTVTEAMDEFAKKAKAGGGANIDKGYDSIVGHKMKYGSQGCVEAVVAGGAAAGIDFWKKQKADNVVDCDTLKENASAAGYAVEDYDANNPPRKGDIIIYDRGEDQHAVTADGKGGYWGNSSSLGEVVHRDDYTQMGGKVPTQVIRTGTAGGSGSSGGHTVNVHDSGYETRMLQKAQARAADYNRLQKYKTEEKLQNYWQQIQGTNSAEQALAIFNKANSTEDYQVANAVEAMVAQKYRGIFNVGRGNGGGGSRGGGSRGGGSRSGRVYYNGNSGSRYTANQVEDAQSNFKEYQERLADPNDTISKTDQRRYNKAARILNDIAGTTGDNIASNQALRVARHAIKVNANDEEAEWYLMQEENGGFSETEAKYYLELAHSTEGDE